MLLSWEPLVHLAGGGYEAWVSPSAGGRLCRLLWHGPDGDRELVVPVDSSRPFDEDQWPKQGAFPMLPYANRLKDGRFGWGGRDHQVRVVPGHAHGLHGVGHRRPWSVAAAENDRVLLEWRHEADPAEWPWPFTAHLAFSLSGRGLHVSLALRNDAPMPMPAILGWHPYVPTSWLAGPQAGGVAFSVHALEADGSFPTAGDAAPTKRYAVAAPGEPHTIAIDGWAGAWSLRSAAGDRWCFTADCGHLVHHVPVGKAYACIEPVTSLPGRLHVSHDATNPSDIALAPGAWRRLEIGLEARTAATVRAQA